MDAQYWTTTQKRWDPPVTDSDVLLAGSASRVLQVEPKGTASENVLLVIIQILAT